MKWFNLIILNIIWTWEIKFLILGVFLRCCDNVVAILKIMLFINVGTTLWQHENWCYFSTLPRVVTMLPECYSLVEFQCCHIQKTLPEHCHLVIIQCWSQHSDNIYTMLPEFVWTCDLMSFPMLHKHCGNGVKLCNFPTLWQCCHNLMAMLWQSWNNVVI